MKKSALVIACFDSYSYSVRTKYVEKWLLDNDYKVTFLISDYDHRKKDRYRVNRPNVKYIHVPNYKKNMSIKRIVSHIVFSLKVRNFLKSRNYDLIYCTTPPNFIFFFLKKYNGNIVFEIGD